MIFLLPLGREQQQSIKPPWATMIIMLLCVLAYLSTWPDHKAFIYARLPGTPLYQVSFELAKMMEEPTLEVPNELRELIRKEKESFIFPSLKAEKIFNQVDTHVASKYNQAKLEWTNARDRFRKTKIDLLAKGITDESSFDEYKFDPSRGYFPGIITHMFLHAGLFHLLFNMLFLWIVGVSIEERWGPLLFLAIYFSGGIAAALAQAGLTHMEGIGMVGASGAVAAIMGAFLIRHFNMPIKMFYFIFLLWFKTGTFVAPAWLLLVLWLAQQIFWLMMTRGVRNGGVGYAAHAGGFIYGAIVGYFVLKQGIAQTWEKKAESTEGGIEMKIQEAAQLFKEGKAVDSCKVYDQLLTHSPKSLPVLLGALNNHIYLDNQEKIPGLVIRTMHGMINVGNIEDATALAHKHLSAISKSNVSDVLLMSFGHSLTTLNLYVEASRIYMLILKLHPQSIFRGKAIFSLGKVLKDKLGQRDNAIKCFQTLCQKPYDQEWRTVAEAELRALQ